MFEPAFIAIMRYIVDQLEHPDALERLDRLAELLTMADAKQ